MSTDTAHNRFIPVDADVVSILYPALIRVAVMDDGSYCLADNMGFVLTEYELAEILTAVKPFYDSTADRAIIQYNDSHFRSQKNPNQPIARPIEPEPKAGYVYVLKAGPYYKIGVSTNIDRRIKQLSTLPPFDLELIFTIQTSDMYGLESKLHERFDHQRQNGEWFILTITDIEWIRSNAANIQTFC
jgi:hypothetical protein